MFGLIWFQIVCKCYQQTIHAGNELRTALDRHYLSRNSLFMFIVLVSFVQNTASCNVLFALIVALKEALTP